MPSTAGALQQFLLSGAFDELAGSLGVDLNTETVGRIRSQFQSGGVGAVLNQENMGVLLKNVLAITMPSEISAVLGAFSGEDVQNIVNTIRQQGVGGVMNRQFIGGLAKSVGTNVGSTIVNELTSGVVELPQLMQALQARSMSGVVSSINFGNLAAIAATAAVGGPLGVLAARAAKQIIGGLRKEQMEKALALARQQFAPSAGGARSSSSASTASRLHRAQQQSRRQAAARSEGGVASDGGAARDGGAAGEAGPAGDGGPRPTPEQGARPSPQRAPSQRIPQQRPPITPPISAPPQGQGLPQEETPESDAQRPPLNIAEQPEGEPQPSEEDQGPLPDISQAPLPPPAAGAEEEAQQDREPSQGADQPEGNDASNEGDAPSGDQQPAGDQEPKKEGEASGVEAGEQGTANRLDRLKSDAKKKFQDKAVGESFRTLAKGNALIPGSRRFLYEQMLQLFVLSPFAYVYIHVHFFCYPRMPEFMGFRFEEPDMLQKMILYPLFAAEGVALALAIVIPIMFIYLAVESFSSVVRVLLGPTGNALLDLFQAAYGAFL